MLRNHPDGDELGRDSTASCLLAGMRVAEIDVAPSGTYRLELQTTWRVLRGGVVAIFASSDQSLPLVSQVLPEQRAGGAGITADQWRALFELLLRFVFLAR